jgi:hypothetical protein
VVQWQDLNPGQKGNDGIYSILGGLNYYIHGDDLKLMVNYIHTWSDFRQANPDLAGSVRSSPRARAGDVLAATLKCFTIRNTCVYLQTL